MDNSNCLSGIRCPDCGQSDEFAILVTHEVLFTDDGTDFYDKRIDRDISWDSESYIRCLGCEHEGTVEEFTMVDLNFYWYEEYVVEERRADRNVGQVFEPRDPEIHIGRQWGNTFIFAQDPTVVEDRLSVGHKVIDSTGRTYLSHEFRFVLDLISDRDTSRIGEKFS